MNQFRKILVVCPANMVTGGPEALHQLVHHMRAMNLPAYMVYTPFGQSAKTPAPYQKYQVEQASYEDVPDICIIFPEIYPMEALKVRYAKAALWWLSLDNFLERKNASKLRDRYHFLRAILRGKRPIRGAKSLKRLIHLSQTEHATRYLRTCGIEPLPLIDSINEQFLNDNYRQHLTHKKNLILYNPTKGKAITSQLIRALPQYQFLPLKGYSPDALSEVLYSAKLYIEFGQHPGRDRLPREAAMHGCCIITHPVGSAANSIDVPIPEHYKIDSSSADFLERLHILIEDIFQNFPKRTEEFEPYRTYLKNEPTIFKAQISSIFTKP